MLDLYGHPYRILFWGPQGNTEMHADQCVQPIVSLVEERGVSPSQEGDEVRPRVKGTLRDT
jgi:hypothetical protein